MIPNYKPLRTNFLNGGVSQGSLAGSSIYKFSPEMFVFWNVEINRSGLKYAQFLL